MSHVATLVSSPGAAALTYSLVDGAAAILPSGRVGPWLDPGVAVDIAFHVAADPDGDLKHRRGGERDPVTALADRLRGYLAPAPVDIFVQPAAQRRKKLLLADMDSTMIGQECIDELADFAGLKAQVAALTERAMRGELAFEPALRQRVALLKGLPVGIVDEITAHRLTLTPGARALVATMKANGAYTCLVSGGFTLFTGPVAGMIGFDEHRANRLVVEGGRIVGRAEEPILGRDAKLATLIELRRRFDLPREATLAVGDGANDLGMIEAAGLGVAFRAKPAVAAAAQARIDHGDLTALLYAQGYARRAFVDA